MCLIASEKKHTSQDYRYSTSQQIKIRLKLNPTLINKVQHHAVTSNLSHSIKNLKVLTIFNDYCVCGFSCLFGLNCETATKKNATAIAQTLCYLSRQIGLPDLGIACFRVAINLHLILMLSYGIHTAVRESSFSKQLALL